MREANQFAVCRVGKAKRAHHQEAQSVIDGGHVADAPLPTLATALVIVNGISSRYEGIAMRISMRYVLLMIRSFKGKFAEPILQGRMIPKGFPANLAKVARRKLIMVDSADFLEALNSPPGNRLEALKGDLAGKHSIRINDQWRIVFRWTDAGPEDVEIIDYH